jgi:long-chain acyl-CoA synthetase
MQRGELTNTLKLKRGVIAKNYKSLIDKMYEE